MKQVFALRQNKTSLFKGTLRNLSIPLTVINFVVL